jgi:hypothetical protein
MTWAVVAVWSWNASRSEMRLLLRSRTYIFEKMCILMSGNSCNWQLALRNYTAYRPREELCIYLLIIANGIFEYTKASPHHS